MCDCYSSVCSSCGMPVEIHIGDFSTSRSCVEVYCPKPKCRQVLMDRLLGKANFIDCWHGPEPMDNYEDSPRASIWKANPSAPEASNNSPPRLIFTSVQESGPWKGKAFIFLVKFPQSICTNGVMREKESVQLN